MNHRILYFALGYLSIAVGIGAALCIFNIRNMFYGLSLSILGMLVSVVNIYLNQKYYSDEEKYPKGYLGMVFSSLPVLFLLFVIFRFKHS
jgi:hypothetical protein